ncbi:hypothetical protein [Halomicronema hongdechloris]|uniref:hypothetical protein n=1 Tax=Halomicronema hongdechloris TaxID=1209493 RepID=UPI001650EE94|nr:hypothetical protein [Halomicronema hongdechloris]
MKLAVLDRTFSPALSAPRDLRPLDEVRSLDRKLGQPFQHIWKTISIHPNLSY